MSQMECIMRSRRSSHEERGLKFVDRIGQLKGNPRRSSHEERGLKCQPTQIPRIDDGRSSHEERGLK